MSFATSAIFEILSDPIVLARRAARWMCDIAQSRSGSLSICLSGGSTPRALYETLAAQPFVDDFPWERIDWFWGDERFVPHGHQDSNFRMATEAMLAHVPVRSSQIHPVPFDGFSPMEAAENYEETLRAFYRSHRHASGEALFDIVLLGLGTDGHLASLFPNSPILAERQRWVAPSEIHGQPRISLTYPALESSSFAAFLVAGAGKREILKTLRAGGSDLPASSYAPVGELRVFSDRAACPS